MPKKLSYNMQKRIRYDKLLILIAIFGVAGSVIIFRSYADTRVNSNVSGSYAIDRFTITDAANEPIPINSDKYLNLRPDDQATIELATARGKQYCLNGYNRSGASIKLTLDEKSVTNLIRGDLPIDSSNPPSQLGCIEAQNSTNDNKMMIENTGGSVWIKDIIVY